MKKPAELFLKYPHLFTGMSETTFTDMVAFMEDFKQVIAEMETELTRDEIILEIKEIRQLAAESIFLHRAQNWPRGYQGDFETIEYILHGNNHTSQKSPAYYIEDFFIHSDICRQHKNKVHYQTELIRKTIAKKPSAKIISIGCGTSEDMVSIIDELQLSNTEITLVDVDKDALDYSLSRLEQIKTNVTIMQGNIYKIMRSLKLDFDLIIIGGVFDYLNDRTIVSILQSMRNNLTHDGLLFFTNINKGNPYRIFMEYLSDWLLIERSHADIMHLINQSGWNTEAVIIEKENTKLTHLITLNKKAQIKLSIAADRSIRA